MGGGTALEAWNGNKGTLWNDREGGMHVILMWNVWNEHGEELSVQ